MIHLLFENFLDGAHEYKACEIFWQDLVHDIAQQLGQTGEWFPWIPRTYANGTPIESDGNPIYDGRSEKLDRAFRIIQHRANNELEISAWLKSYEEEYTELPRDELVINLSLSEESAELARILLRKWMISETTIDEMTSFIRDNLSQN